jgi:hypothetical protein
MAEKDINPNEQNTKQLKKQKFFPSPKLAFRKQTRTENRYFPRISAWNPRRSRA